MNNSFNILGIALIVLAIVSFIYQGVNFGTEEHTAKVGNMAVTATTEKVIKIPPYVGGIALVVGLVLLVVARRK